MPCAHTGLGGRSLMIWRCTSSSSGSRSMAESHLFSEGVDRLLEAIRPYGGLDRVAFPQNLTESGARRSPGEPLHGWFVRLVDAFCEGNPKRVAVEDNIAVFVRLVWKNKNRLLYANIQTLVAT